MKIKIKDADLKDEDLNTYVSVLWTNSVRFASRRQRRFRCDDTAGKPLPIRSEGEAKVVLFGVNRRHSGIHVAVGCAAPAFR